MTLLFRILLIIVGSVLSLICVFFLILMLSRRTDTNSISVQNEAKARKITPKQYVIRLQIDSALWGLLFLLLAVACFWGVGRL